MISLIKAASAHIFLVNLIIVCEAFRIRFASTTSELQKVHKDFTIMQKAPTT